MPVATVEGDWYSLVPSHPKWNYRIDSDTIRQSVSAIATEVYTDYFHYTQSGDTIYIDSSTATPSRVWLILFHGDSVMQVTPKDSGPLGHTFFLRKKS